MQGNRRLVFQQLDALVVETDRVVQYQILGDLLGTILKHFPEPTNTTEEVAEARSFIDGTYNGRTGELMQILTANPPVVSDSVWPVLVLRVVFREFRIIPADIGIRNFVRFANRYLKAVT